MCSRFNCYTIRCVLQVCSLKQIYREKFSIYFAIPSETSFFCNKVSLWRSILWLYLMTSTDSFSEIAAKLFNLQTALKEFFFVLKLLDSTLIAIVVVVWEEEAHKASLIFYGFKTHSLEIHHYIVNHTKFDCFLCVFKLISSSRWWWDCLVLNFIFLLRLNFIKPQTHLI